MQLAIDFLEYLKNYEKTGLDEKKKVVQKNQEAHLKMLNEIPDNQKYQQKNRSEKNCTETKNDGLEMQNLHVKKLVEEPLDTYNCPCVCNQ